jgi:hypothetical protein
MTTHFHLVCGHQEWWSYTCNSPIRLHYGFVFLLLLLLVGGGGGGGVQLRPLCTSATDWPNGPAAGDYDHGAVGGMMIGR